MPGSKLPSTRELAKQAGVNPNTMQRALQVLQDERILIKQSTTGRYVTTDIQHLKNIRDRMLEEIKQNYQEEIECIDMDSGSKFPVEYTGRGQDISPEFVIKNLSPNAKTLAVTLEDLSHPIKDFTHWIIWNIPATDRIKKNIPAGKTVPDLGNACQGVGYGLHRYAGPKPPKGKKHTYRFTIYSLDYEVNINVNSMKRTFLRKAEEHIIQKGSIIGEFE